MDNEMIYLDNNATTVMPVSVRKSFLGWCNMGNPSSSYATAKEARVMMNDFRVLVGKLCGFDSCCQEDRDYNGDFATNAKMRTDDSRYKVIFTSGASESNCTVVGSVVDAFAEIREMIPHVVISAIEHKSILDMVKSLETRGRITASYVAPTPSGHIRPEDVEAALTPNTCLICVMHANNETGAINDVARIGEIAHAKGVPFHCDAVQTFGKFPLKPVPHIDSFSISFHKFQGPPGVGALVIKQRLLNGWKLHPLIYGSQNEGYRGGTENLPGIGAAFAATKLTMQDRMDKNATMNTIRKYIMVELGKRIPTRQFTQYIKDTGGRQPAIEIVFLSAPTEFYLPNTLLLSVVKRTAPAICNGQMKKELEDKGIVVSVGSACNTASPKASHVLYAMGADDLIRKGTLRISLGDNNTLAEAKVFVREFLTVIQNQLDN